MPRGRSSTTTTRRLSNSSRTPASCCKQVFRTEYDVVIMQGEAILGLEAAAGRPPLPRRQGAQPRLRRLREMVRDFIHKYGGETIELAVPYNDAIDPEDVRRALQDNPGVKFLSVVHSETPSARTIRSKRSGPWPANSAS